MEPASKLFKPNLFLMETLALLKIEFAPMELYLELTLLQIAQFNLR